MSEFQLETSSKPDEGSARRIRPGTKAVDMVMGPPLVPLSQLDSPFQLQEHLKALYATLTHTEASDQTIPITKETAMQITTPPQLNEAESVDRNLWLYELCRFLTQKANIVSIFLMNDTPACSSQTCPEMRASEWQYLCAVHDPPKSCCAIDYCNHTLDWAANVLTSPRNFPSRLALGGEGGNATNSMKHLTNIFRRVYRIFAHAWFQHREIFWSVESTHGLYILFKTVCDEYHLIPEESYTIPAEAAGAQEASDGERVPPNDGSSKVQILRKDASLEAGDGVSTPPDNTLTIAQNSAATARRHKHKHTPSTGSLVDTITEGLEEEEESTQTPVEVADPSSQLQAFTETSQIPETPLKDKDPSPVRQLPKLDLSAIVPKYEPRAPEDPTPTPTPGDTDPLAAEASKDPGASDANSEKEESVPEVLKVEIKKVDNDEEEEVKSPSGGSIRTGGSDVLQAILGHLSDGDEEEDERERERRNSAASDSTFSGRQSIGSAIGSPSVLETKIEVTAIEDDEDDDEPSEDKKGHGGAKAIN
ncbi:uncharacterized protein A1O9_04578 [Exophiala aquamarina CBS 119918]|uniref:Mob1 family protein n=1 Tax=Exophiala aquamarina CBS 119918 TaxID=1182545 RepID=A0A072PJ16_9EURO|nr:uncharacterized protein A1O9_04578 [Exophiala aquamarina CBS 119918]KEF59732.1 hypothetical protein A1O9_04578 [Exophiala aquamarina CBS 119918]